jgi:hypothetical protein
LFGESATAAHVAAATLMTRFQPPGWRIACGPYNVGLEARAPQALGIAPSPMCATPPVSAMTSTLANRCRLRAPLHRRLTGADSDARQAAQQHVAEEL